MADFPDILNRYRQAVDTGLKAAIAQGGPLFDMLRYHMGWLDEEFHPLEANGGKAVRPSLCLYACEAVGGDWHEALPAAVSVELLHNFSLVHDDIQDGDTERRHRPTVWYLWGYSRALNGGTALHMLAHQALPTLGASALSPTQQLTASRILTQAGMDMIEGQTLDISFESRSRVSTSDYLSMIEKKTGSLLQACLHMGASIGTEDQSSMDAMRAYGHAVGRLFQIRDDILGVWGRTEDTGKPAASDLHRRKKSLPVVHALQHAGLTDSAKQFPIIYKGHDSLSGSDIETLLSILDELGTLDFCHDLARAEAERAWRALSASPVSAWGKEQGSYLIDFLLCRAS